MKPHQKQNHEFSNVGWVSVFCVTHQALRSNTTPLLIECLAAQPVGYSTNGVSYPPYIDDGTAEVRAMQVKNDECRV
jgi:hypothetical protein